MTMILMKLISMMMIASAILNMAIGHEHEFSCGGDYCLLLCTLSLFAIVATIASRVFQYEA